MFLVREVIKNSNRRSENSAMRKFLADLSDLGDRLSTGSPDSERSSRQQRTAARHPRRTAPTRHNHQE
jgi:hypothetical protein